MKLRFVRRSPTAVRAVPVAPGAVPPKPRRAAAAGFTGAPGQVAEVATRRRRLLLVGGEGDLAAAGAAAVARLGVARRLGGVERFALDARGRTPAEAAQLAAGARLRAWRYDRLFTRPDAERPVLRRIDVLVDDVAAAAAAWAPVRAGVQGVLFARGLVAEPSNTLTPAGFVERLRPLAEAGVLIEVLGPERLAAEGLGGLLAVGGASAHPPCLAVLRWPGRAGGAPVAFVGKGITFDTGGLCLKPAHGMWEMRADMAGAAACAGAVLALALRRSPAAAVAVLPLAENALGGSSYRPGDVLRLFGGTTVEVVDTDAEGRLVLADALGWTLARLRPSAVIDLGTLTGSIVTALGMQVAGLFGTDEALAAQVAAAGAAVEEPVWRMPLSAGYREALDSEIADLRHCADGRLVPDACHAAAFLREFVGDVPWAHLDIAGVESREAADDRHPAGPAGWGVRLLDRLVAERYEDGM